MEEKNIKVRLSTVVLLVIVILLVVAVMYFYKLYNDEKMVNEQYEAEVNSFKFDDVNSSKLKN